MKCFKCGAPLPEGTKYCPKCGTLQEISPQLVEQAREGNQEAVTELYQRSHNPVYCTVKALIQSEDAVLDIVQDSYVKGFSSLSQLQEPEKFIPWMKTIAHNKAIDYLRKKKPMVFSSLCAQEDMVNQIEDDRPDHLPDVVVDQKETSRLIRQILDSLSEDQRVVVGLYYYENLSIREISQMLEISENTVKSRLFYGRKKIETQVKELEKQGTKLYSLAPLPFLMLLFRNASGQPANIPHPQILQAIQDTCTAGSFSGTACSNTSSADASDFGSDGQISGTAGGGSAPAGAAGNAAAHGAGEAVKVGVGAAGKGLALKITAGVVVAAMVAAGGVVGVRTLTHRGDPAAEPTAQSMMDAATDPTAQSTVDPAAGTNLLPPEELYKEVLDSYSHALNEAPMADLSQYPYINTAMVSMYLNQLGGQGFYYTYYDLNGDGIQELLVGYGVDPRILVDVYGANDNLFLRLVEDPSLGERSQLSVYPDGTMILVGSGGAELHSVSTYRWDGRQVNMVHEQIIEGPFDLDAVLQEQAPGQAPLDLSENGPMQWESLLPWEDTASQQSTESYNGVYMNGNGLNAGCITIVPMDDTSVSVRLEAFANSEDHMLSTVFETIGQRTQHGIVMDIQGHTARFTDSESGFFFDADPELKEQWGLDPYTYAAEYVRFGDAETADTAQPEQVNLEDYNGYAWLNEDGTGFRLQTTSDSVSLIHLVKETLPGQSSPCLGEYSYYMDMPSSDVSGNIYTFHHVSNSVGQFLDRQFYMVRLTFQDGEVVMDLTTDEHTFAGSEANVVYSGTYTLK